MAEQAANSDGFVEAIKTGTVENLQRLALVKPPAGVMTAENLNDFLQDNQIVDSLSTVVAMNGFDRYRSTEIVRAGSVAQYFKCGFALGVDPYDSSILTGTQSVYFQGGRRNCVDPDRKGLFDYEYNLRFPIMDYETENFSLNRTNPIKASFSSHRLKMEYDSQQSDHCLGSEDFTGLMQEVIGDLILNIQGGNFRQNERRKLASQISSVILSS